MALLRRHRTKIICCICLVLLLLPIAQSLACSSVHTVASTNIEDAVFMVSTQTKYKPDRVILNSKTIQKSPGCHSTKKAIDNPEHEQVTASESVCDGDCCQYCMVSYITHTSSIVEQHYNSIYLQNTIFSLKPDFLVVPATPPPIV